MRRRGARRGNQGCRMPNAWPDPRRAVDSLRYIGPRITDRFAHRGIYTLQDLIDYVNGRTLAQNRVELFQYVFLNARNKRCVFRSESANSRVETKHWPNPWPNPPYNLANAPASRPGLVAGDFEYCVRRYNRCGWEIVEAYLRQRADVDQARIPAAPDRNGYCRPRRPSDPGPDWCRRADGARRQSSSEEDEGGDGFGDEGFGEEEQSGSFGEMERNVQQYAEEHGRGAHFRSEEEEEERGNLEEVVLWRKGDPDPWQAFDIHQIRQRQREQFRDLFAGRLSDLDETQRIAYVLWAMSTAQDLAAPSADVLAELAGIRSTEAARRRITANLGRGAKLFSRPQRGRYALRDGLFTVREATFLRRIKSD